MSVEQFPYGAAVQEKIVAMMLWDEREFADLIESVKPEHFNHPALRDIVRTIKSFHQQYHRPPTHTEFAEEIAQFLETHQLNSLDATNEYCAVLDRVMATGAEGHFEYVRDQALEFLRYQAIAAAVIESAEIVRKRKNYNMILDMVREALSIGEDRGSIGVQYFEELENRLERRRAGDWRRARAVPTMTGTVDGMLAGGLARRELGIIMGPMKRGKTVLSVNFARGAIIDGANVAHYIAEGSEDRLATIYDAMISGVAKDCLKEREEEVRHKVAEFGGLSSAPGLGRLFLRHFPALDASAMTIENNLNKIRLFYKVKIDLVIIDYLGLLVPTNRAVREVADRYYSLGQITKELLSLAQRGDYAIWLLHQSRRSSYRKATVDLDDSGDSIEPMRDADVILTLNQTEEDAKLVPPKVRLFLAGGREMSDRKTVDLAFYKELCQYDLYPA